MRATLGRQYRGTDRHAEEEAVDGFNAAEEPGPEVAEMPSRRQRMRRRTRRSVRPTTTRRPRVRF